MEHDLNLPEGLNPGGAGERLWKWLVENAVSGVVEARPLASELCCLADRLQQVREKLATQGLNISAGRGRIAVNPLLGQETRLLTQYEKMWRTLGLADDAEEERRPVGRPPGT